MEWQPIEDIVERVLQALPEPVFNALKSFVGTIAFTHGRIVRALRNLNNG